MANIHAHQIEHMKGIIRHGGICFIIIRFSVYNETYYLGGKDIISFWNDQLNGGKKSVSYKIVQKDGYLIPWKYQQPVDYLKVIDRLYF